jgi:hypothetical protein
MAASSAPPFAFISVNELTARRPPEFGPFALLHRRIDCCRVIHCHLPFVAMVRAPAPLQHVIPRRCLDFWCFFHFHLLDFTCLSSIPSVLPSASNAFASSSCWLSQKDNK